MALVEILALHLFQGRDYYFLDPCHIRNPTGCWYIYLCLFYLLVIYLVIARTLDLAEPVVEIDMFELTNVNVEQ